VGYEINWNTSKGNTALFKHPLYIKYSSSTFGNIDGEAVKNDLAGVMATADSAEVCAYLSWLIRSTSLLVG
jgi:hypothetical protein